MWNIFLKSKMIVNSATYSEIKVFFFNATWSAELQVGGTVRNFG